jgi:tetratricopeptide (TPR) repeat protein
VVATFLAAGALTAAVIALVAGGKAAASCERAGDPIAAIWSDSQRAALRAAFERTKLPYASTAATAAIAQLDDWTARWQRSAEGSCTATLDHIQPAELHGLRQACLDQLGERLAAIVAVASAPDATLVANAGSLAAGLPGPERCDDISSLSAVQPPAESSRTEIAALRTAMATTEAEMLAGRLDRARPDVEALAKRAEQLGYQPLRARSLLLVARMELAATRYDQALAALHAGARAATAARDLELLAELWIELTQTLGNDVKTLEQADVFDGYAESLVQLLPDRDALVLQLEFARCNRNLSHTRANDAATLAKHCESTISRAERARPPRTRVANAARTRLGHFQRLLGKPDAARATLVSAVDEAVRVHGPQHPDTAVARYSLGIAEVSQDRFDAGIAQLREALAIRRAAFPGNSVYIVESLQGLGDALASKGEHREAIQLVEQALAMLDALGKRETLLAVNANILLGMSLEEVDRTADATTHYLRAADIADRAIQHRESLAVLALRLAAEIAARTKHAATGVIYLERALRLLERAKAAPLERGKTQQRIGELLLELGDPRARGMIAAARASYATAGATEQLAAIDALMRRRGWR